LQEQPEYRSRIIGISGEEISRHLAFTAQINADLERFEQCSRAHPGKDRQTRLHRKILDTTSGELYAAKRSQIAHRVLPRRSASARWISSPSSNRPGCSGWEIAWHVSSARLNC
jgi:hypothetical protein